MVTYASDLFGRTVTGSLGSADTGGAYTPHGTEANTSVDGSKAVLALATAWGELGGRLASVSQANVEGLIDWEIGSSSGFYWTHVRGQTTSNRVNCYEFFLGVTSGTYRVALDYIDSVGTHSGVISSTDTGVSYVAGDVVRFRYQADGTNFRIRAWKSGTAEPSTWTATGTHSTLSAAGHVGFSIGGSVSHTSKADNWTVTDIPSGGTGAISGTASGTSTATATFVGGGVAFGTRPASGAVSLTGQSGITIENKHFKDLGAGVIAIRLQSCTNITIRNCDFENVAECVYALSCTNVTVEDCRYKNIIGPAQPRTGANVANFVQVNGCTTGLIRRNKGIGGDTEDIVSIHQSSGYVVEDNHFEGTNWTSPSGSGIALSDGGGTNNIARRNILLNPGQVGIFIAGGTGSRIENNTIYGEQRALSNVGMYVSNYSTTSCSGHTVTGNKVNWYNASGVRNDFYNAGNCGPVAGSNDFITVLNPATMRVNLNEVSSGVITGTAAGSSTATGTLVTGSALAGSTAGSSTASASLATASPTPGVPVVTAKVDWGGDDTFSAALDDISDYLLGLEYSRGRSADYGSEAIGAATLTLRNSDARFTPDRNWIDNPSFEANTSGWASTATAHTAASTLTRITTDAAFGSACGEWSGASGTPGIWYAIPYRLRSGVTYTAAVRLKRTGSSADCSIGLGNETAATFASNVSIGTAGFTTVTVSFTPTATLTNARLYVRTTATTGTTRADAVQLNVGSSANTYIEAPTKGQLLPGRKVHITGNYTGTDSALFFGTIERLAFDAKAKTCRIYCQDAFRSLASVPITIPAAQIPRTHGELRALALQAWAAGTKRTSFSDSAYNIAHAAASFESNPFADIAHVQTKSGTTTLAASSLTVKLNAPTGAGSLLVIAVAAREQTTFTVATDTSPAPVKVTSQVTGGSAPAAYVEVWHVYPTAGAQRIVVTAGTPTQIGVIAAEYKGVYPDLASSPNGYDQAWTTAQTGSTAATTAPEPSRWPELAIGVEVHDTTSVTTSSSAGWTQRASVGSASTDFVLSLQDRSRTAPVDEATHAGASFNLSASSAHALIGVTYPKVQPFRASGDQVVGPAISNKQVVTTAKYGSASYEADSIVPSVVSTTEFLGNSGPGFTINKPSGVVSGDLLLLIMQAQSTTTGATPPAGWTAGPTRTGDSGVSMASWYKVAGGSEPADYTWTGGSGIPIAVWLGRIVGADTTTPVEASAATGGTAPSDRRITIPSATPVTAGTLVIAGLATNHSSTASGQLFRGYSEYFGFLADMNQAQGTPLGILQGAQPTATATGTRYAYYAADYEIYNALTIVIRAAGSTTNTKSGVWLAVGDVTNSGVSADFDLEKSYSWSVWVKGVTGSMTVSFGSESQSRATDSSQTQTANATFQYFSGTWTPGGVGIVNDVHLRVYSHAGVSYQIDGLVVVEGTTPIAYEEQASTTVGRWTLPSGETGLSRADYSANSDALTILRALNEVTGSTHIVRPLLTAPYFEYIGTSLAQWQSKTVSDAISTGIVDAQVADLDRPAITNVVRLTGTDFEVVRSDSTSIAAHGPLVRTVSGGGLYAEATTPAAVGDYYLSRDGDIRARPTITLQNVWPTQLERNPDDLIVLTLGEIGAVNQRFVIASIRVTVSNGGAVWLSEYALEEFPF